MDYKQAKESKYQGVTFGIPTFGMISKGFTQSQFLMGVPIFTNVGYHFVQGKPVDVARNEIAHVALENKQGYVFFRDDDTLAPREALIQMIERFPLEQRTNPGELGNMIVGGVVYSKTQPPTPMIFKEGHTGGYEDWEFGDLLEVDVIGMGCTLIPTGAFRKTLPFVTFWQCINVDCPINWTVEHKEAGDCPTCKSKLVAGFFKTIRDKDDDGNPAYQTEDTYFLLKAKKAGCKTFVDCGVQCQHEVFHADPRQTLVYYWNPQFGPCWQKGDMVYFLPDADSEKKAAKDNYKKPDGPVKFNVGCGGVHLEGYVNIDLFTQADFQCDVRDLGPALQAYGQPEEIRASHVLEHFDRNEVLPVLRNWIRALKPGGKLDIEVPDGLWACENFIKKADETTDLDDFPEMVVYGNQMGPGEYHKTALYEKRVKLVMKACEPQLREWSVETVFPEDYNQQVIRIKATKHKEE